MYTTNYAKDGKQQLATPLKSNCLMNQEYNKGSSFQRHSTAGQVITEQSVANEDKSDNSVSEFFKRIVQ